jgi:chromosome partitioning protein
MRPNILEVPLSVPIIAFFNTKGGAGTTPLVYHIAWMMAEIGLRVAAADLDPQANLTANFLDDDQMQSLWPADATLTAPGQTVYGSLAPLIRGVGDIAEPPIVEVSDRLYLIPGDLALSRFEDELSNQWPDCLDGKERAFRVISAFWRLIMRAAQQVECDVVLIDVGPNLGAINRSAIVAADHVVVPLAPDLFSLQGLQNLGPTLMQWREQWNARRDKNPDPTLALPGRQMCPAGYVLLGHGVRLGGRCRHTSDGWPVFRVSIASQSWLSTRPRRPSGTTTTASARSSTIAA